LWILNAYLAVVESWTSSVNWHSIRRSPPRASLLTFDFRAEKSHTFQEECPIPPTDPNIDLNCTSLSNVSYALVSQLIDGLYPPFELEKRNAQSRTDGYWKYVSRGEEPPKEVSAAP
jgi:hypothetical protein